MKERGIAFHQLMILPILAGSKTETRRIVRPQPNVVLAIHFDASITTNLLFRRGDQRIHCPHGKPGDSLWVREAWRTAVQWNHLSPAQLPIAGELVASVHIDYLADGGPRSQHGRYRHAKFMPRWASRISLNVTGVRVERLQDISPESAIAEGIEKLPTGLWRNYLHRERPRRRLGPAPEHEELLGFVDPVSSYRSLFELLHGPTAWEENPWVWVIQFRLL